MLYYNYTSYIVRSRQNLKVSEALLQISSECCSFQNSRVVRQTHVCQDQDYHYTVV